MKQNILNNVSFVSIPFLFVVLAPPLSNYKFYGQLSFGDILIFLFCLSLIFNFKTTVIGFNVVVAAVVISIVSLFFVYDVGLHAGFYRTIFYYILFIILITQKDLRLRSFFRIYTFFAILFSISIIFQWFIYVAFGISIPLQLSAGFYEPDTLKVIDHVYRSGGWFKEPSYFVLYVTPLLFFLLEEKRFLSYFVISIAALLSTSSLFFFIFILSIINVMIRNKIYFLAFLFVFSTVFSIVLFFLEDLVGWIFIRRVVDIFQNGGTLQDRFLSSLDIVYLSKDFFSNNSIYLFFVGGGLEGAAWYSSFSSILAALGWAGVLLIVLSFFRLGFIFGFIFLAFMLTTHIFSGVYSIFIALAFMGINSYRSPPFSCG